MPSLTDNWNERAGKFCRQVQSKETVKIVEDLASLFEYNIEVRETYCCVTIFREAVQPRHSDFASSFPGGRFIEDFDEDRSYNCFGVAPGRVGIICLAVSVAFTTPDYKTLKW